MKERTDLRRIFLLVLAGALAAVCLYSIAAGLAEVCKVLARGDRPHVFVDPAMRELPEGLYGLRIVMALAVFDFLCCMAEKRYTQTMYVCAISLLVLTVLTVVLRPFTLDRVRALVSVDDAGRVRDRMIPIAVGEAVTLAAFALLTALYLVSKAGMRKAREGHFRADAPVKGFRLAVFLSLSAAVLTVGILRFAENLSVLLNVEGGGWLPPVNLYTVQAAEGLFLWRYLFSLTLFDFLCFPKEAVSGRLFVCATAILSLTALTVLSGPAFDAVLDGVVWGGIDLHAAQAGEVLLIVWMLLLFAAFAVLAALYLVSKRGSARPCAEGAEGKDATSCGREGTSAQFDEKCAK